MKTINRMLTQFHSAVEPMGSPARHALLGRISPSGGLETALTVPKARLETVQDLFSVWPARLELTQVHGTKAKCHTR